MVLSTRNPYRLHERETAGEEGRCVSQVTATFKWGIPMGSLNVDGGGPGSPSQDPRRMPKQCPGLSAHAKSRRELVGARS